MELLRKYGPLTAVIVGPLLLALVAIFKPDMFDRIVESLGILFGGLFTGIGVGNASKIKPAKKKADSGFATPELLLALLAAALLVMVLGGCPGAQRCPDGDKILVSHKVRAPSELVAKCSSEDFERVRLEAKAAMELFTTCAPGTVPAFAEQRDVDCGRPERCPTARLTCVPRVGP